ncbi:MAG: methyltransferase domain-containing protein [Candidatus Delongbacteria bacterium]|nr:methyltransferase domain-containing protein [Candidatus Delongbacteria bacterium]
MMDSVKLNLGCGYYQIIDGWINLDYMSHYWYRYFLQFPKHLLHAFGWYRNPTWPDQQKFFRQVINHNILNGIPLSDQRAEFIYASHFLEHFTRDEGLFILRECYRVLQSGGTLRLVVPDLALFIQAYRIPDPGFIRYLADRYPEFSGIEDGTDALNTIVHAAGHRYIHDFQKLRQMGGACGFSSIQRKGHADSRLNELNRMELLRQENLVVEMLKP